MRGILVNDTGAHILENIRIYLRHGEVPQVEADLGQVISDYPMTKAPQVPRITRVIFNRPATIVFWEDGTKTVVKCSPDDTYSKETGLAMAIAKKCLGNRRDFYETFEFWIPEIAEPEELIVEPEELIVESMRKALCDYCEEFRSCDTCPLDECARCGQGTHFYAVGSDGVYSMTEDEIREAYRIAFKTAHGA